MTDPKEKYVFSDLEAAEDAAAVIDKALSPDTSGQPPRHLHLRPKPLESSATGEFTLPRIESTKPVESEFTFDRII